MKFFKIVPAIAAVLFLAAVACKKEEPVVETSLSVSPTELSYTYEGGAKTVTVTTNASGWEAESDQNWLTIVPANDGKSFAANASVYSEVGAAARSANISVKAGSKSVTVKVSQTSETVVFIVEGETAEVPAAGATVNVKVQHNTTYSVGTLPDWITNVTTKAVTTDNLKFKVAGNTTFEARTAEITFTEAGGKTGKAVVKQAAAQKPDGIATAAEFVAYLANPTADTKITADLDFTGITLAEGKTAFCDSLVYVLDGQNHSIKNFTSVSIPLVGINCGTVKNIVLDRSCSLTAVPKGNTSFIVRDNRGTVDNCVNNADINLVNVTGTSNFGAIVAKQTISENAKTVNCVNNGSYVCPAAGVDLGGQGLQGGVLGRLDAGTVENCCNTGNLTVVISGTAANYYYGGVVGFFDGGVIRGCINTGTVAFVGSGLAKPVVVGGVIGSSKANAETFTKYGSVIDCQNTGEVTLKVSGSGYSNVGGVIAYAEADLEGCSNSGKVSNINEGDVAMTGPSVGGVAGRALFNVKNCTNSGEIVMKGLRNAANAKKAFMGGNPSPCLGGVVGCAGPCDPTVESVMSGCKNTSNNLVAEVTMGSTNPTATHIGCVCGLATLALDGCENSGNIRISNNQHKSARVGGIIGTAYSTVRNCTNKGTIEWEGLLSTEGACSASSANQVYVGGVAGSLEKGSLAEGCINEGTERLIQTRYSTAFSYIGGIAATASGDIRNCENKGAVESLSASNVRVGGIAGTATATVQDCKNSGSITVRNAKSEDTKYWTGVGLIVGHSGCTISGGQYAGSITCTDCEPNTAVGLAVGTVGNTAKTWDGMEMSGELNAAGNNCGFLLGSQIDLDSKKEKSTITTTVSSTTAITHTASAKVNGVSASSVDLSDKTVLVGKLLEGFEDCFVVGGAVPPTPSKLLSITNTADFLVFLENCATSVYTKDDVVTFANDIDLKGINIVEEIKKAEGFSDYKGYADTLKCTLDGKNHKILNYNNNGASYLAKVLVGTIQNLVIDASCTFAYGPNSGSPLVYENFGTFKNVTNYANASITGDLKLTATVHMSPLLSVNRSVMIDCVNYGNFEVNCTTIEGPVALRLGGICASCASNSVGGKPVMTNCVNHGKLSMKGANNLAIWYFGGIIGVLDNSDAMIENCSNDGEIKVELPTSGKPVYIGGLAGQRNDGSVKNFTNTGNLYSNAPFATTAKTSTCIGGLFGTQKDQAVKGVVEDCTVNCKITTACVNSGKFDCAGMITGGFTAATKTICFGSEAAPIKVAGSIESVSGTPEAVTISESNYADYLVGELNKLEVHKFNAAFLK